MARAEKASFPGLGNTRLCRCHGWPPRPWILRLVRLSASGWSAAVTRDLITHRKGKGKFTLVSPLPTSRRLPHLYPDLPLEAALRHLHQVRMLPVLDRADFPCLEDIISQPDVLQSLHTG